MCSASVAFVHFPPGRRTTGENACGLKFKSLARAIGLAAALLGTSSVYAQENNTLNGEKPLNITSAQPTRGVVFFTATINSTGGVASCFGCNTANTKRLGVGLYQIDFGQNVQAVNGWSRWVQVDTLTTGTENAWCNTADRAGDNNAVWVNCQTTGGPGSMGSSKATDTSFFLFVAR
jgi:hypothetical protein